MNERKIRLILIVGEAVGFLFGLAVGYLFWGA